MIRTKLLKISPQAVKVYIALLDNLPLGKKSEPITNPELSTSKIAELLEVSRPTVTKCLNELEEQGVIERIKGKGSVTQYLLLTACKIEFAGCDNEALQGCKTDFAPHDKPALQVNPANDCGTRTGDAPKNIKNFKKEEPTKTLCGYHPRKIG